jgi:hypothetical protein
MYIARQTYPTLFRACRLVSPEVYGRVDGHMVPLVPQAEEALRQLTEDQLRDFAINEVYASVLTRERPQLAEAYLILRHVAQLPKKRLARRRK